MRASKVRILPALDPGESYVDPTFVLVETTLDGDETTTTIEHVTSTPVSGKLRWRVTTLGQSVPLSHAGALEWAVSFAAMHDIPIVYQRDEARGVPYAAAPNAQASTAASSAAK
ncbi:MAG TPA: hypothetical protein VKA43_06395 [Gammaproteobacteria bacterium]|nr:hypothetical protein [Gammaproteobacteria bacterium]